MARILIVEDDGAHAEALSRMLQSTGSDVVIAIGALEGLAIARVAQPDLIVMDVCMRGMGGLEATVLLKSDPVTSKVSVLALTPLSAGDDAANTFAAGCDAHLAKPQDLMELCLAIDAFVARRPTRH